MFEYRELYAPGHFGNSYEVAGELEMRNILTEARWWGFNVYGDWFDTINLTSKPYINDICRHCWLTDAVWRKKKRHFSQARDLGFKLCLGITPNHVFADQVTPQVVADQGLGNEAVYGHLICPSKPAGREIILNNYRRWFADLAASDITLSALSAGAYDFGGCRCDACRPWITTVAGLAHEIHGIAREHFPNITMRFCGWFWQADEHNAFVDWIDTNAPNWVQAMSLWIPYDKTAPPGVESIRLPKGCRRAYFVHIGYGDHVADGFRDQYGQWGPTIAPNRIARTLATLQAVDGVGFRAYSEGIHDDVNKALLAGLGSDKFASADEVLRAYAERYFNADAEAQKQWARWLTAWGDPWSVDLDTARRQFNTLSNGVERSWRLEHLASKLRLYERKHDIDAFLAEREHLRRGIYGLTPLEESVFEKIVGQLAWLGKQDPAPAQVQPTHRREA